MTVLPVMLQLVLYLKDSHDQTKQFGFFKITTNYQEQQPSGPLTVMMIYTKYNLKGSTLSFVYCTWRL